MEKEQITVQDVKKDGKVISFINMKGGVGKTTLCVGIGEYLARWKQKSVLFIDIDPQFNTTQTLMDEFNKTEKYLTELQPKNKTVRALFKKQETLSEKLPEIVSEEIIEVLAENMAIIPGTIDLILEDDRRDFAISMKVKDFIKNNGLSTKYDYIFIDCPPTISMYTDNALIASDYILIPNKVDNYSILGIKLLKIAINKLKSSKLTSAQPIGIVYTNIDTVTDKTQRIIDIFESDPIVDEYGMFTSRLNYCRDLQVGLQGNIASKYMISRDDISLIVDEFLERIKEAEKNGE